MIPNSSLNIKSLIFLSKHIDFEKILAIILISISCAFSTTRILLLCFSLYVCYILIISSNPHKYDTMMIKDHFIPSSTLSLIIGFYIISSHWKIKIKLVNLLIRFLVTTWYRVSVRCSRIYSTTNWL